LALTALLVFAFMKFVGMNPIAAKITATIFALAWNYLGRRLYVFKPEMPVEIWRLSTRAVAAVRGNWGRVRPSAND
jgi:putative flippase GtrA